MICQIKCYDLSSKKIIISRHVLLDEQHFPFASQNATMPNSYDFLTGDISPYLIQHMLSASPQTHNTTPPRLVSPHGPHVSLSDLAALSGSILPPAPLVHGPAIMGPTHLFPQFACHPAPPIGLSSPASASPPSHASPNTNHAPLGPFPLGLFQSFKIHLLFSNLLLLQPLGSLLGVNTGYLYPIKIQSSSSCCSFSSSS